MTQDSTAQQENNVVNVSTTRIPYDKRLNEKYGIDLGEWRVLVDAIFPSAKSFEGVSMALAYCKARGLDIMKRPVHIVPMWSSEKKTYVETVWPGISEIRTTASRTGAYAGKDAPVFGPDTTEVFSGEVNEGFGKNRHKVKKNISVTFPEWCEVTVHRMVKGQRVPFTEIVYWKEAYASRGGSDIPNEMWCKRARGQLAKCAEAAALRCAFPEEIGNEYAAEEMAGKSLDITPESEEAPTRPAREDFEQKTADMHTLLDEFGESMGEFSEQDLTQNAVAKIEAFTERDTLEAFLEHNEGFEAFPPRSDVRQAIASAYNAARENLHTEQNLPQDGTPQEPAEGWEDWSDSLVNIIREAVNKAALDGLLAEHNAMLDVLHQDAPALHTAVLNAVNTRAGEVTAQQEQE